MSNSDDRRSLPTNLERRGDRLYFRAVIGGKLFRKSTGFRDLPRARRRATEIENAIRGGQYGWEKPEIPTFGQWCSRFLDAYYPGKRLETHSLSRVRERWATRPLNLITAMDVREYFRVRQTTDKAADASLARELVTLKRLFKAAISDKLIETNPCDGIRFKPVARTRILTAEHETALRSVFSPTWDRYLTVALGTGVRAGEQRHLRPMDLRNNDTLIWVRPESNKTKKGREVPVTPAVLKALQEQEASREGDETTPYWTNRPAHARIVMLKACEKLNLPRLSPHDLRRTFGTRAAERGVWPKHLQMILGHEKIDTTMRYYVSLENKSLVDALVKAGF